MYQLENHDLRLLYLYEWKLNKNSVEAEKNINNAFGTDTANERTIRRWFKKFDDGEFELKNIPRGRPNEKLLEDDLREAVTQNPSKSVRELATDLSVSKTTVHDHLKAIGMVKKLQTWVPHELTTLQKLNRLETCLSLLARHHKSSFLHNLITCDEKWVLYDNRKRSGEWLDKHQCPSQFPKPELHQKKVMFSVWWSVYRVVHYCFLEVGTTINSERYCVELQKMHEKLTISHPAIVNRKGPIILHDNARPHISKVTVKKLHDLGFEVLPHPPYSPDLSPTDFHLFKNLSIFIKGRKFKNLEEIKSAVISFMDLRNETFYKEGIESLPQRWQECINVDGSYFN